MIHRSTMRWRPYLSLAVGTALLTGSLPPLSAQSVSHEGVSASPRHISAAPLRSTPSASASSQASSASTRAAIAQLKQQGAYTSLAEAMQRAFYAVESSPNGSLSADNVAQRYTTHFTHDGVQVQPRTGAPSPHTSVPVSHTGTSAAPITLRLSSLGYGAQQQTADTVAPQKEGERVEYRHAQVTEWYVNTPQGLEQGFTLAKRLHSDNRNPNAPLSLWLRVDGKQHPRLSRDATSVLLGSGLRYKGLLVKDSTGKRLTSSLSVRGQNIVVRVQDQTAHYPLVVDPFIASAAVSPLLIASGPSLAASNAASGDNFGYSVAVSGDTAVVGAVAKNNYTGAAYVFVRSGSVWTQQQQLAASDAASSDQFGASIAVSGDTAVVGAYNKNSGTGAAYAFVRSGNLWTQQQNLTASDTSSGDQFGYSVALSGDMAVVGAFGKKSNSGIAYAFARSGSVWTQQAILTFTDAASHDGFGASVAVSGDTVMVGAYGKASNTGAAYVYGMSPVGAADQYVIPAGQPYTTSTTDSVLSNDRDVDALALTSVLFRAPQNGAVTLNTDGTFTYTPNAGFAGTDTFQYLVRNSVGGLSDPVLVTLIQRAQDVSASVSITRGGFARAAGAGNFTQKITLTNTGDTTLANPLSLVLNSLPAGVSITNADGTTSVSGTPGSPYINVAGPLAPGASVSLVARFADPAATSITYTVRVLAGPGAR